MSDFSIMHISLIEPLDYPEMVAALKASSFIATDSGDIQEEAPALAKPVLVLRNVTERPEAIEAGTSWLVGTNEQVVYESVLTLATDREHYDRMAYVASPFGDGRAAERIVGALRHFLGFTSARPEPFAPSF